MLLDKVPGAKWLRDRTKQLTDAMRQRYGVKTTLAIVASGQAFGWSLMGVGVAVSGVPWYVPGSTLIGMAPAAALAEVHYQLRSRTRGATSNVATPDAAEIERLGRELYEQLSREWSSRQATTNAAYEFLPDADKVKAFRKWLKQQLDTLIQGKSTEELWRLYIQEGFKKGAARAYDDVTRGRRKTWEPGEGDFYRGSREEFLKSSFAQPVSVDKVKLLAGRSFDDLEGVTHQMSVRMSRVLTDGLVQGKGMRELGRDLAKEVDVGRDRALTIARTEIIRAHAEGQLQAFDNLGVEEVGVAAEWATAEDDAVCEDCSALEGVVLTVEEARGLIPQHPNCRCAWIPANVGEKSKSQQRSRDSIEHAFSFAGIDKKVASSRPRGIL
jgi:SPP1 gp7 family putative phage head morphogenesis protein